MVWGLIDRVANAGRKVATTRMYLRTIQ
jgi:hypothetical protein